MVSSGKCTSVAYQTCRPIGFLMVQLHVSSVVLILVSTPSGDQCASGGKVRVIA